MSLRRRELGATMAPLCWLALFCVLPSCLVVYIAFKPADTFGGVGSGWTLAAFSALFEGAYASIIWRTLWISAVSTSLCLMLGLPTAYFIATSPKRSQQILLLLVITPFWTSFLVRIFAWKVLLRPDGPVLALLTALGLLDAQTQLLYNSGAVLLVTVYTFLPFAILPLYAAVERFDFALLEAARDLGAGPLRALVSVFLPGIRRGLLTAALVVLVPCLGSYVIPDLVGGPQGELLGTKIAQRTFVDRNLPQASAAASLLTMLVVLPALANVARGPKRRRSSEAGKELV